MSDSGTLRRISPYELNEVLDQVRQEKRRELVLLGPAAYFGSSPEDWPDELKGRSVLQLTENVAGLAERLLDLDQLRLLSLWRNNIGEVEAKKIAKNLTQLASLDLSLNEIGDVGAKAIAENLIQLTSLNLRFNDIGDAGATAIAGKLTQLTSLNLNGNRIGDAGAKAIAENLIQLSSLHLWNNDIGDAGVRAIAGKLTQLTLLDLTGNRIGDAGARVIAEKLTKLTSLDLTDNRIGDVGAKVIAEKLIQLTSLKLGSDHIGKAGAKVIAENLPHLISLYLRYNDIGDAGARVIAEKLTQLTSLDLRRNDIGNAGTTAISQKLTRLTSLNLSENSQLTSIAAMSNLSMLQELHIARTGVTDLSPLKRLIERGLPVMWDTYLSARGIHVEDCPLVRPTPEVILQGHEAVLNYFREIEDQGFDRLFEAKVLILGEGGAGKTSLVRRLYFPDQPLPGVEETTRGIDVHHYEFKTSENGRFRLNVWDFGGQQIYHATHQFFLTKSSLYVLVDDTKKDNKTIHDEGFKYWLEVVETLSDRSPVLIFQNEKGGRSKQIDEAGIKGRFPNVLQTYRGNLEKADSARDLKDAIEFHTQKLPHIDDQVPAKWVTIRAAVEQEAEDKPYISQDRYFEIYRQHLKFDRTKALHLSRYLHDLGVFLHFQGHGALGKTVILQNRWATDAVFNILDDEKVKSQLGHFTIEDCRRVWSSSEYADMHEELLSLMAKFELCYLLPDTREETWLAPQLLSPSKPGDIGDWADPGDLVLCYRYEFLPKGLISRLMVRMHRFVKQPEMSWTTGALFEREQTYVLAEVTPQGDEIVLRGRGPESKALLSVIASDLDALNASFAGLKDKVGKWVPCICDKCAGVASPTLFEQKHLLRRKRHNKLTIECPKSFVDVSVLELLDGLKLGQLPQWAEEPRDEKIIRIFLASSEELREDRDAFDLYFRQQNDQLRKQGLYLEIVRWENFLDAMSSTRLQDEYNRAIRNCDVFVSLFKTKTGKYTAEEFDVAWQKFQATSKPRIYTYFRKAAVSTSASNRDDLMSLWDFQKKFAELGHFYTEYESIDGLQRHFRDQLDKLRADDLL